MFGKEAGSPSGITSGCTVLSLVYYSMKGKWKCLNPIFVENVKENAWLVSLSYSDIMVMVFMPKRRAR